MLRSIWFRFWYRVAMFAVRRGTVHSESGTCSNRRWHKAMFGYVELTVVSRDTAEPDGYTRLELGEMLAIVREHEARQGWEVPEPFRWRDADKPTEKLTTDELRKFRDEARKNRKT